MATKDVKGQRATSNPTTEVEKAQELFKEIKGALHGVGDGVNQWILPNEEKEKLPYPQEPIKG